MANPNVGCELLGSPVDPVVERSTDGNLWTKADSGHIFGATDNRNIEQPQDAPLDVPPVGRNIVDFSQRGGTVIDAMMKEGGDYQAVNREEVEEHSEKQANQQPASDLRHRRSFIQRLLDCFRIFFQRLCEFFICRTKARKEDLSQKEDLLKNESPEPKKEAKTPADKLSSNLSEPGQNDTTAKYGSGTAVDDIVKQEYSAPITSDTHLTESLSDTDKKVIETNALTSKTNKHAKPDSSNVDTVEPTEGLPRDCSPMDGSASARDEKDVQEPSMHTEAVIDIHKISESSQFSAKTASIVHDQEPIKKSPDTFETPSTATTQVLEAAKFTENILKDYHQSAWAVAPSVDPSLKAVIPVVDPIHQAVVVSNEAPAGSKEELVCESAVCGSLQQNPIENGERQEKDRFVDKSCVFVASAEGQIVEEPRPSDWEDGQPDVVISKPMRSFQPGVHGVFFADYRGYAEELPRPPEWGPIPEDPSKRVVKFEDASWAVIPRPVTAVIPSTNAEFADAAQVDVQESSASGNLEAAVEINGNQKVASSQLVTSAKDREEIDDQEKDRFLDKSGVFVVRDDGQMSEEPRPNNWGEGQPDVVITKPRRPSQPGTPGVHGVFFADNHGYAEELPRPPEWGPEPENPTKRLVKFNESSWAVAARPVTAVIPSTDAGVTDAASLSDSKSSASENQELNTGDIVPQEMPSNNTDTSATEHGEIERQEVDRFLDKSGVFVVRDDGQTMEEQRPHDWGVGQPDILITKPRRPSQPGTPGVHGVFFADNRGYAEELPRPPEWGPEPEDPTKMLVKFEDSSWAVAPRPIAAIIPSSSSTCTDVASAGDNLEASTAASNAQEVASSDRNRVTSLNDSEEVTSTKDQEEIDRQEKDRFSDKSGIFVVRDDGQTMEEPRPNDWGKVQPDMVITKPRRPSQPGTPGVHGVFFADNRGYAEELPRPPEWGPEPEDPTKRLVKFEDSSWAVAPRAVAAIIPSSPREFSNCRASQPCEASIPAADKDEIRDTPDVTVAAANAIKAERERAATRDKPDEIEVEHRGVGETQHSETCFQTASTAHARVIEEVTSCDFTTDVTDEIDYSKGHAHTKSQGLGRARDETVRTAGEDETVKVTDGYGIDAGGDQEWHLKDGGKMLHTTDKEQTAQREQTSEGQNAGGREATSDRAEWYSPERNPFEGYGVLVDRISKATNPETLQHRECAADSEVLLSEHVHGIYSFMRDF